MTLLLKAKRAASWSLLDNVFNQLTKLILLIYLARMLSPSDFGLMAMIAIFSSVSEVIVNSGFSQALIQRSKKVTNSELNTALYANILISVTLYAFVYSLSPLIASFYGNEELVSLTRVVFVSIIFNSFALVPKSVITIDVDFKRHAHINIVSSLIASCAAVYLAYRGLGYWALAGMVVSRSISSCFLAYFISKWKPSLVFSLSDLRRMFKFGSNLLVAGLISNVVNNLYSVLLGKYTNATQLGFYQQGNNYTNLLAVTLTSIVQGVTYPIMTQVQENKDRLVRIYAKVISVTTLIAFPIFFGFASISNEFVNVFMGDQWESVAYIITILSFSKLPLAISSVNMNILSAIGRSDLFLKTDLVKVPIFISTLVFSLPYGIYAVAISQVANTLIAFCINTYYPGKLLGFGLFKQVKSMLPAFLISLVMFFTVSLINLGNDLGTLFAKVIVGFLLYISLCYIFRLSAFQLAISILLKNKYESKN